MPTNKCKIYKEKGKRIKIELVAAICISANQFIETTEFTVEINTIFRISKRDIAPYIAKSLNITDLKKLISKRK
jgi:hypothetical protein